MTVGLKEYEVTPSVATVDAGTIRFEATNNSTTMVHELAVLRVKDDGSFENMGEVEDIDPGSGGSVVIDLEAGRYQLACLIVPGEAGSTVDHYQQGMHTDFTVEVERSLPQKSFEPVVRPTTGSMFSASREGVQTRRFLTLAMLAVADGARAS